MEAMRERRGSPDGDSIAIRSDYPADGPMAFGVFVAQIGGHWAPESAVADWDVLVPEPKPEPKSEQS
jgi:hypothetical protein